MHERGTPNRAQRRSKIRLGPASTLTSDSDLTGIKPQVQSSRFEGGRTKSLGGTKVALNRGWDLAGTELESGLPQWRSSFADSRVRHRGCRKSATLLCPRWHLRIRSRLSSSSTTSIYLQLIPQGVEKSALAVNPELPEQDRYAYFLGNTGRSRDH